MMPKCHYYFYFLLNSYELKNHIIKIKSLKYTNIDVYASLWTCYGIRNKLA